MSKAFKLDWSRFTRRLFIKKNPSEVFDQWSNANAMEKWFLKEVQFIRNGKSIEKEETFKVGDTYIWKWHGWDGQQEGKILQVEENKIIEFSFGKAGNVKIDFVSDALGCQVILEQYNIPTDEQSIRNYFYGCTNGWSFWMLNCKVYLEHGIIVNNKNNPLPDDIKCELVNA